MGHASHDDRAYPATEQEMLRVPSLAQLVKRKDRRIAELEDLVRDLTAIGCGQPCRWCDRNTVEDHGPGSPSYYIPHEVACPYRRSLRSVPNAGLTEEKAYP